MKNLSVMIKPASAKCNAGCKYCFYRDEVAVRSIKDYGAMPLSTARTLIDKTLEYLDGGHLSITFQGGEPTLAGYEFFQEFFEYLEEKIALIAKNAPAPTTILSLQTNGLTIDKKWAKLLKKHNVLVGVSLDGTRKLNAQRVACGKEIYPRILDAIRILQEEKVDFNVLSVIHKGNVKSGKEIMQDFIKRGFRHLQFIPYLGEQEEFMLTPEDYGAFLIDTFSIYGEKFNSLERVSVREFDNYIMLLRSGKAEQCGMNGRCEPQLVFEGDGTAFPCDFYCTDDYVLGNINDCSIDELINSPIALSFRAPKPQNPACATCPYHSVCLGGCKRYARTPFYCESHKIFFEKHFK